MLDDFKADFLFALRSVRQNKLLSAVVVITLAIGIGLDAGVYSVINITAFRPRIDDDPESFAVFFPAYAQNGVTRSALRSTLPDFTSLQQSTRTLRHLTAWSEFRVPYSQDEPSELRALLVACNFFSVYSLPRTSPAPLLGRLLTPDDCREARPVILLSEGVWRNRLGADPQIAGKIFHFNQQPLTVIGVLPSPYAGSINGAEVWMPYTVQPNLNLGVDLLHSSPPQPWLSLAGRLNHGFARRDAASELQTLVAQLDTQYPGRRTTITAGDGSWFDHPNAKATATWSIPLIFGALTSVVLIACANVATLLLARAATRQREVAIRLALGASRARLVRMLITESVLLAAIAGIASLYLALHIPKVVDLLSPRGPEIELHLEPDWRVFLYLAAVTVLAGLMAGVAPALESLRVEISHGMKGRLSLSSSGAGGGRGLRRLLVSTQIALSLVLLIGAGVMVRGVQRLVEGQSNAEVENVVLARIVVPRHTNTSSVTLSSHRIIESRVLSVPGVASVAWTSSQAFLRNPPLDLEIPAQPIFRAGSMSVSPTYFRTMRIPILRGHSFDDSDAAINVNTEPVIVNESFARRIWPGADPLGKVLRVAHSNSNVEVVGIARGTPMDTWGEDDGPLIYTPWRPDRSQYLLVVRAAADPAQLLKTLSAAIKQEIPTAVIDAKPIPVWMSELTLTLWRLVSMIAVLGGAALLLTIIGIYGVVAFAVSRRVKEIGIRMAVGARPADVVRSVMVDEVRPVLIGLTVGILLALPASIALQKTMERAPFRIDTRDPLAYGLVCLMLLSIAFVAMFGPARRAAGNDPLSALREE